MGLDVYEDIAARMFPVRFRHVVHKKEPCPRKFWRNLDFHPPSVDVLLARNRLARYIDSLANQVLFEDLVFKQRAKRFLVGRAFVVSRGARGKGNIAENDKKK